MEPYRTASPARLPYWVDVSDPSSRYQLRQPLVDIVEVESPVHIEVLYQRIRSAWGIGRVGSRIRSNINGAIKASKLIREGDFVRDAGGVSENDLTAETARLFGWTRRGPDITLRLDRLVASLQSKGAIMKVGEELRPGTPHIE